mgnify:CR=1 FL=1
MVEKFPPIFFRYSMALEVSRVQLLAPNSHPTRKGRGKRKKILENPWFSSKVKFFPDGLHMR